MAQPPTNPTRSPTLPVERVDARTPGQAAEAPVGGAPRRVRTHIVDTVVVLEVAGWLGDVVADLDLAIRLALADGPRGVVCDLTAILEDAPPGAVKVLATVGRHARDWPATPVAVACSDPWVRAALNAHPVGGHLIVTPSVLSAVSAVLATPIPAVERLRLAPQPIAPRVARDFVSRTLLGWGLGSLVPDASLIVSELVTNSIVYAGTDVDLSIASHLGKVRLAVRDHSPDLPRQRPAAQDLHGRGLAIVAGLSRTFGYLPTADDGKVVWAVIEAPHAQPSTSPHCPDPSAGDSSVIVPQPSLPELGNHHAVPQHGPRNKPE